MDVGKPTELSFVFAGAQPTFELEKNTISFIALYAKGIDERLLSNLADVKASPGREQLSPSVAKGQSWAGCGSW